MLQIQSVVRCPMNQHVGQDNARLIGLIDSGRMTRKQLNEERKQGLWKHIHRGLIEDAFQKKGIIR